MDKDTTFSIDYRLYYLEVLGLSIDECECILGQMNGLAPNVRDPYPIGYLGMQLMAGAEASAIEHTTVGRDLSYPRNDSPEMPAFIAKVAIKVSEMMPWQQDAITSYALGFWDGIAAAAREREELLAASSAASPQG